MRFEKSETNSECVCNITDSMVYEAQNIIYFFILGQANQTRVFFERLAGAVDQRIDTLDSQLIEYISQQKDSNI